jgi:uncharacterized protein
MARVVFAALIALALYLHYRATHVVAQNSIDFHPGLYERVPMNSGPAVAQAMQAVYTAPDPGALNDAVAVVQGMADGGNAEAAFRLGRYYHLETGDPDYALAFKYYQIAAAANHAWATNNLGTLYRDGLGVTRDYVRAHDYFQKAARENSQWAYVNLAEMSFLGRGVPSSQRQGFAWLEQGAANHCHVCLIEEASIYHSGAFRVRRNPAMTVAVLNRDSALGDPQAALIVAELYLVGDGVPQSSARAFGILSTLSDHGYGDATNLLGELSADRQILDYLFDSSLGGSEHIPTDLTRVFPAHTPTAIRYWTLASQQGSCQALIDLSSVFDRGAGVNVDPARAAEYVERAVACDPTNGFYLWKLGDRFDTAKGVRRDCVAAARYFEQSLDYGYADAAVNLGYIYDKGCDSIARDDHRAFQIYLLGAKLGVPLAQNNVGAMLKHGRGVPAADPARGYAWIKLAAMQGDDLAMKNLNDRLFTPKVRALGLVQLVDVQRRLAATPRDRRAIMSDPWY